MPVKLLESERLKYMILQIASGHFGWNRIIKAMPRMKADPAGILIKIGQGAKPGDGGLLPAAKVAPHIQAIRGVPRTTSAFAAEPSRALFHRRIGPEDACP